MNEPLLALVLKKGVHPFKQRPVAAAAVVAAAAAAAKQK